MFILKVSGVTVFGNNSFRLLIIKMWFDLELQNLDLYSRLTVSESDF